MHGAFAMRGSITDNQGAPIVLERARENLGSRSAEFAGEDNQGAGIDNRRIVIVLLLDFSVKILHLDDWAIFDEEPCEFDGFLEGAAAVVAQIENDPRDILLFQFLEQAGHIGCRALRRRSSSLAGKFVPPVSADIELRIE